MRSKKGKKREEAYGYELRLQAEKTGASFGKSLVETAMILLLYLAAGCFAANFVLGLLVQFRVVDTNPFKWLHHALFFAAFVSAGAAALVALLGWSAHLWPLLGILALFTALPRVRAGTPGHAALASAALVLYVTGFALL